MSNDRDRNRPSMRPDRWDQLPPTPYRPQGRPPAQSQADGFASRDEAPTAPASERAKPSSTRSPATATSARRRSRSRAKAAR